MAIDNPRVAIDYPRVAMGVPGVAMDDPRVAMGVPWCGASVGTLPRMSWGGEASDGASPCESKEQPRGVPGWWS